MVRAVEGVFRDGRVELSETPAQAEGSRVIVTFLLDEKRIDLATRNLPPQQAADLRARLSSFADDWDRPEMDAYDKL